MFGWGVGLDEYVGAWFVVCGWGNGRWEVGLESVHVGGWVDWRM